MSEQLKLIEKQEYTLNDLPDLVKLYRTRREERDAINETKKQAQKALDEVEDRILDVLEANEVKTFDLPDVGKVTHKVTKTVKIPQSLEAKQEFLTYLKNLGDDIYTELVGVNSSTLNRFYRLKDEEAVENGEVLDIPGLELPSIRNSITWSKG